VRSRGHGDQLPRKLHRAIEALLTCRNHADAAKAAGVSLATLQKWLRLPCFKRELDEANAKLVEHVITRLRCLSSDAVATLQKNLSCGVFNAENRAAMAILENLRAMQSHSELEARLQRVEEQMSQALAHHSNGRRP
jgi:hypothetical protein